MSGATAPAEAIAPDADAKFCASQMLQRRVSLQMVQRALVELRGGTLRQLILDLCDAPGGRNVFDVGALLQHKAGNYSATIYQLRGQGLLHDVKVPGELTRYFTQKMHAVAYARRMKAAQTKKARLAVKRQQQQTKRRADQATRLADAKTTRLAATKADILPKAAAAPVHIAPRGLRGPVITPPTARITRVPSVTHDPRYQVAPGTQVAGAGFAALRPGQYPDTEATA